MFVNGNLYSLLNNFSQSVCKQVGFIDYDQVFKNIDIFITHGGAGSVQKAIQYGLKIIIYP